MKLSNKFKTKALNLVKKRMTPANKMLAGGMAAGIAGGGFGLGVGYGLGATSKSSVSFTDASKTRIKWKTFPGGPTLEGPTEVMKEVFRVGKQSRGEGIKMLVRLLKEGTIKKI